ncbi:MAG: hypothetical protein JWO49_1099 [Arthrobacter sp.]|nr:hypothetical protein [Arthrobacter sp.]
MVPGEPGAPPVRSVRRKASRRLLRITGRQRIAGQPRVRTRASHPTGAFPHKTRSVAAAAAVGFRTLPPKDRKRAEPTEKPATLRLTPGRNAEVGIRTAPNGEVELRHGGCHRFRWCPRRFVLLAHFILLKRSQSQLFRRAEINIYYTKVYGTFFHVVNGSEPPGHKALES